MWNDCPRRSAARALRREIEGVGYKLGTERRGIGAVCGTATHAAAAWSLSEKMRSGFIGPESTATDIAVKSVQEAQRQEVIEWDATTRNGQGAEKTVIRQVQQYRKDVAAKVQPKMVEQYMEAEWGPIVLTGHIDLLDTDDDLRDIKGGRTRPNAAQYGGYTHLLQANGITVHGIIEDGIARVDLNKPQPSVESRPIDVGIAKDLARDALADIHKQITEWRAKPIPSVFPANANSALCSVKYCPAWGTDWCKAWRVKKV